MIKPLLHSYLILATTRGVLVQTHWISDDTTVVWIRKSQPPLLNYRNNPPWQHQHTFSKILEMGIGFWQRLQEFHHLKDHQIGKASTINFLWSEIFIMRKQISYINTWVESASSPLISHRKASNKPKLETIMEEVLENDGAGNNKALCLVPLVLSLASYMLINIFFMIL
ncbi:uncharacterized protein LOC127254036 [Andrographis paniculata]|uniref:uncharacterized protein LOC127254036 n=1 Tax=Andrographis paniculata TaxID=175694 RepID=UPI0021E86976|nr:uncharacterized protein LOC127254036 [Andrographis paniculata]